MSCRLESIFTSLIDACSRSKQIDITSDTDTKLKRCLTTLDLTLIGVGGTLGAGIYILTGEVARNIAGPAVVISFVIAAIASILSGFCYAEFGARFPKAGSAYVYCYVAIGEFCAFFIGWTLLLEYIIGVSAIGKGAANYIDSLSNGIISNGTIDLLGEIHANWLNNYFDLFGAAIICLFTIILCFGVKSSSLLNSVLVTVNILTITVIIIAAFIDADPHNWNDFAPFGFSGILSGASTCFFAFIGFDVIATTAEETKDPEKSIPRSILATIVVCLLAYVGVSSSITLMVPYYELDAKAALSKAFAQHDLKALVYVVAVGATFSLLGCTLASSIPPSRILFAMATDGLIPGVFARVNSRTSVPVIGIVTSGILIALFTALLDLKSLAEMLSIGTLLAYSIVDISVLMLRYRKPIVKKETEEIDETRNMSVSEPINGYKKKIKELQNSQIFINAVIFVLCLEIFSACVLAVLFSDKLFVENNPYCILVFTLLLLLILLGTIFLFCLEESSEQLSFRVPLVPWIPIAAIAVNFCLMLGLSALTWIRLAVWTAIGMLVYFAYSMHHSAERKEKMEYTDYIPIDGHIEDDIVLEYTSEKTTLLCVQDEDG